MKVLLIFLIAIMLGSPSFAKSVEIKDQPITKEFIKILKSNKQAESIAFLKKEEKSLRHLVNAKVDKLPVLHYAIETKQWDLAEDLIRRGANLNAMDAENQTALIYATKLKNKIIVGSLSSMGADITLKDKTGSTALDYAKKNGADDIVIYLTKFGST